MNAVELRADPRSLEAEVVPGKIDPSRDMSPTISPEMVESIRNERYAFTAALRDLVARCGADVLLPMQQVQFPHMEIGR